MEAKDCREFCLLVMKYGLNATMEYQHTIDGQTFSAPDTSEVGPYQQACTIEDCDLWLKHQNDTSGLEDHLLEDATTRPPRRRPPVLPEPPLYILVCVSLLYITIFIAGTVGNFLVVFVVCRTREMRNTTNFFLVNLSVADLLVIIVCMPSAFLDIFSKDVWYLGPVMCKYSEFKIVYISGNLNQSRQTFDRLYLIFYEDLELKAIGLCIKATSTPFTVMTI